MAPGLLSAPVMVDPQASAPVAPRVSVASKDRAFAAAISGLLEQRGFTTVPWPHERPIEVLVVDADRLDGDDWSALDALRAIAPLVELVLLADDPDVEGAVRALRSGVFAVLEHPVFGDELVAAVAGAAERHARARRRIRELASEGGWPTGADRGGTR